MNKTELVEHIAHHSDISKAAATRALESIVDAVKKRSKKVGLFPWLGSALSQLASVQLAQVETHAQVLLSRSKLLRCQSSVQARG